MRVGSTEVPSTHTKYPCLTAYQATAKKVKFNIKCSQITLIHFSANRKFIDYGIWVCTIIFLSLALVFGSVSCGLAIYNTVSNPIEIYLSIYSLYVYNAIAMCSSVMALTLWGVGHLFTTYHDVAVFYTLVGIMNSDGKASLGYSFW